MNSYIKSFFIILGFFLVFSGLNTISYKSNTFGNTLIYFCHSYGCENAGSTGPQCSSSAGVSKKSLCTNITLTCKDCVDLAYSACLCGDLLSRNCRLPNGINYTGQLVSCGID